MTIYEDINWLRVQFARRGTLQLGEFYLVRQRFDRIINHIGELEARLKDMPTQETSTNLESRITELETMLEKANNISVTDKEKMTRLKKDKAALNQKVRRLEKKLESLESSN